MKDFSKIAEMMRADWDRRISHDYRFWMSDGHESDERMWLSGERDFDIVTRGIADSKNKTILELGCGVGRLLKAAVGRYANVIGVDVSAKAIEKAGQLLGQSRNLSLVVGNGFDLHQVETESVDVAFSFAALTSIPTEIIASYVLELNRIIKPGGELRLQVYLGKVQPVAQTDTLHLRCYERECFNAAMEAAGFAVTGMEELVLPFQVSFKDIGIEAMIVACKKTMAQPGAVQDIANLLLPQGEQTSTDGVSGNDLECWMALSYAQTLADQGDTDQAKRTLEFAASFASTTTLDIKDMLDRIVNTIEEKQSSKKQDETTAKSSSHAPSSDTELFAANMATLQKCFPEVHQLIINTPEDSGRVEVRHTVQGDVIWYEGQCLDHGDKPQAAGETWIKRLLTEDRFKAAKNVVLFGGAGFYHVEALLNTFNGGVSVIEPVAAVFRAALRSRDLSKILPRVTGLVVGESETKQLFSTPDCELAVRPQSQAACAQVCSRVRSTFYGTRGISTIHPTMAILGPIQGGTLPIGAYCLRALNELKQRGRYFDLSGFATGYHQMEQFLHDKMRQSVMQGNYVEMLSQVVLEAATEKPFDILICMAQAPASGRMLTELRKRGVITVLWFVEDYLRFPYWKSIAQFYDYVFTIQKGDCLSEIKKAGAGEVHYLPTACDPMVHRPLELTNEEKVRWGSPISFVGAGYHNRQQTFASLANLPFKIWGTEWPECKPFDRMVQERGRRLTPEEYVKIFNASDINLNLHSSTERDGVDPYGDFINPRTFELASAGAFQLVDERTLLPELFEPGREVITFKNPTDLKDKIEYYKSRPEERKQVAARARERVLRDHTYANRLQEMISLIYSSRFEHLQRRLGTSAWNQMLRRAKQHDELGKRCEDSFKRGEEPILDGLVADIVGGKGKMSETEMKLMFLYHVRKQIIKMLEEDPSK